MSLDIVSEPLQFSLDCEQSCSSLISFASSALEWHLDSIQPPLLAVCVSILTDFSCGSMTKQLLMQAVPAFRLVVSPRIYHQRAQHQLCHHHAVPR